MSLWFRWWNYSKKGTLKKKQPWFRGIGRHLKQFHHHSHIDFSKYNTTYIQSASASSHAKMLPELRKKLSKGKQGKLHYLWRHSMWNCLIGFDWYPGIFVCIFHIQCSLMTSSPAAHSMKAEDWQELSHLPHTFFLVGKKHQETRGYVKRFWSFTATLHCPCCYVVSQATILSWLGGGLACLNQWVKFRVKFASMRLETSQKNTMPKPPKPHGWRLKLGRNTPGLRDLPNAIPFGTTLPPPEGSSHSPAKSKGCKGWSLQQVQKF